MRKETAKKLSALTEEDIYSLLLFALFKMKDDPGYSSISELAYLLNGKSLYNLLEFYGGQTLKVPTLKEFNTVVQSLLLYQFVNVEKIEYGQAIHLVDTTYCTEKEIRECYSNMVDLLKDYEFHRER